MRKKIFSLLFTVAATTTLVSCSKKDPAVSTEWKYNETYHWHENDKGEKSNVSTHSINVENDTCTICGYVDPILKVDVDGVLTELTPYGKTQEIIVLTENIFFIANEAFAGSNAKMIYIPVNVIGVSKYAFDGLTDVKIKSADPEAEWILVNDTYYKADVLTENECTVGYKPYKKLEQALKDIDENNTTIYLLKSDISFENEVDLALEVRIVNTPLVVLESTIKGNIKLQVSAILEFGYGVNLEGVVSLAVNDQGGNWTTGAVLFEGLENAPDKVTVKYVGKDIPATDKKLARGAQQTMNKALIVPFYYYAYGALEFSKDFKRVTSLSPFGKKCSRLTITAPLVGQNAYVEDEACTEKTRLVIKFLKTFVDFTMWVTEGVANHITFGEGITSIGKKAFHSYVETSVPDSIRQLITTIFCSIKSLDFGDSVEEIGEEAFSWNYKLETIVGGSALKKIQWAPFAHCAALKSVNFEGAHNLTYIHSNAFQACPLLSRFILPRSNGWNFGGNTYLYEDLTPTNVANYVSKTYVGSDITRNSESEGKMFAIYDPNSKDGLDVVNHVSYFATLQEAINHADHGYVIKLLNNNNDLSGQNITVNKRLMIEGANEGIHPKTLKCNFIIDKNCYLKISNKVAFTGNVTLKNSHNNSLEECAGICFEHNEKGEVHNATVSYEGFTQEVNKFDTKINDANYTAYGLFNFKFVDGREVIHSLTELGKLMTSLTVSKTFQNSNPTSLEARVFKDNQKIKEVSLYCTDIGEACFENSAISTINFSSLMTSIPNYAFKNCKNLTYLKLSEMKMLNHIGAYAFDGCVFTKAQIYDPDGWKIEGKAIDRTLIADETSFATMLTKTYVNKVWEKEGEE